MLLATAHVPCHISTNQTGTNLLHKTARMLPLLPVQHCRAGCVCPQNMGPHQDRSTDLSDWRKPRSYQTLLNQATENLLHPPTSMIAQRKISAHRKSRSTKAVHLYLLQGNAQRWQAFFLPAKLSAKAFASFASIPFPATNPSQGNH